MFRPLEVFVGLRYTRAKRRNHFISVISLISMLGITLGVMALIVVISVMNGFQKELRDRILGMASHATVAAYGRELQDWEDLAERVKSLPDVLGAAPYVEGEAMLTHRSAVSGAIIRGVDPAWEPQVSEVGRKMVAGSLDALQAGEYGIILGRELANSLNVQPGDRVTVITPQATVSAVGMIPRLRRFRVVGLFEVGMYEYDRGMAFIHLEDAAKLFNLDNGVSGVRLKLDDLFLAPRIAEKLRQQLGLGYWVSDWTQRHANFFRAVNTEKTVMFVILTLIVAVAAFNIVSTLVMVVTDKQADIAILRTLGMSPHSVMAVFMVQGSVIGVVGTLFGVACGVVLAINVPSIVPVIESLFNTKFLAPDVYYISELPSDMQWIDVLRIGSLSLALSLLATLYPAWRASRTQPAEALRYE
jgi:lipoprotein-releasing system permease protein